MRFRYATFIVAQIFGYGGFEAIFFILVMLPTINLTMVELVDWE